MKTVQSFAIRIGEIKMVQTIVSLDVGGTSIQSGLVLSLREKLYLLEESVLAYPSHAERNAEEIFQSLVSAIEKTYYFADSLDGVAIGFPGPFDYWNGISYMRNLGKFDAIYGVRLIPELKKRLAARPGGHRLANVKFTLLNDAWAFALGEAREGLARQYSRVLCLTLGTGCGSAFLVDGKLIRGEQGAPCNGMIYDQPFQDGIVDDYVSRRYLMKCARDNGLEMDGAELFQSAQEGEEAAIQTFKDYGSMLGQAVRSSVEQFRPDVLLLGGQISRALPYMEEAIKEQLPQNSPDLVCSHMLSRSALLGAAGDWLDRAI